MFRGEMALVPISISSGTSKPTASSSSANTTNAPPFATFLLPSIPIPFRKRRSKDSSSSASSSAASSSWASTSPASPTRQSYRFSFGSRSSSSSSASSTSSRSTPPSSPTSPDSRHHHGSGAYCFPSFATALTAEPESFDHPSSSPTSTPARLTRRQPDTLRCGTCATDLAYGAQIVSKGFTGRHGRAYLVSPPPSSLLYPSKLQPKPKPSGVDSDAEQESGSPELVNIRVGRSESRQLVTGAHVVADISCAVCSTKLGWKYVEAREPAQRYKVGKFILETARVVGFRSWEEDDDEEEEEGNDGDGEYHYHGSYCSGSSGDDFDEADASSGAEDWGARRHGTAVNKGARGLARPEDGGDDTPESVTAVADVEFDSGDEDECEDIFAGTWDAVVVARRRGRRAAIMKRTRK